MGMVLLDIAWSVWQERKKRIFEDKVLPMDLVHKESSQNKNQWALVTGSFMGAGQN